MWIDSLWPIHSTQLTNRRSAAFRAATLYRSAALRGPGELFNPEACETGGLGLTVSLGAVRWNTTETPVRERIELFEMNVSNCGDELRHGERGAERPPPVLEAKPLCSGGIRRGRSDSYLVD